MQTDWELLLEVESHPAALTVVRLYSWDQPTVSLGKHQVPERSVNLPYCQSLEIPIVRRPTGGRAVLHAEELTYAVASNDVTVFPSMAIGEVYRRIGEMLKDGLEHIGARTRLSRGRTETVREFHKLQSSPCFGSTSRSELTAQGRKVAGSAQRHLKRSFLQHGSIPLSIDYAKMSRVLDCEETFLKARMIAASEVVGRPVEFDELASALTQAFERWR